MTIKEVNVKDGCFTYPRMLGAILKKAYDFESQVWIEVDGQKENAKNLLDILKLHINGGTLVQIITEGSDEEEAAHAIVKLIAEDYCESALSPW